MEPGTPIEVYHSVRTSTKLNKKKVCPVFFQERLFSQKLWWPPSGSTILPGLHSPDKGRLRHSSVERQYSFLLPLLLIDYMPEVQAPTSTPGDTGLPTFPTHCLLLLPLLLLLFFRLLSLLLHLFFRLLFLLLLLLTLTHGCLKVHGGVLIVLCIFDDPLAKDQLPGL